MFGGYLRMLLAQRGDRMIQRHQPQKTAIPLNSMVGKINAQASANQNDQIVTDPGTMLENSIHPSIESRLIREVKEKTLIESVG